MSNATRRIKAVHYDGSRYAETYELKGEVKTKTTQQSLTENLFL